MDHTRTARTERAGTPPYPDDPADVTGAALASWARTARLCVILLTERTGPVLAAVAWLATRR